MTPALVDTFAGQLLADSVEKVGLRKRPIVIAQNKTNLGVATQNPEPQRRKSWTDFNVERAVS